MRTSQERTLLLFVVMIIASAGVLWIALGSASRHYQATQDRLAEQRTEVLKRETLDAGRLWVPRVHDAVLPLDPLAPAWRDAPTVTLPLTAQAITMPMLQEATITEADVQALTDGNMIVWRVGWADPDASVQLDIGVFSDAVAVQFPLAAGASFMMGDPGKRVQILQWKGLWQQDVDQHFQDVQDLHPNYWADLYWFAEGEFPFPVPESFRDPASHAWFPAYQAGNPMSDFNRRQTVDELVAEGYGSLTPHEESVTRGRGVWQDGRWAVTFLRPLRTSDPLDAQFQAGGRGDLGIAVWDGTAGNVGGRKHWSNWLEFKVES